MNKKTVRISIISTLSILIILTLYFFYFNSNDQNSSVNNISQNTTINTVVKDTIVKKYGIPITNYTILEKKIKKNDFLAKILNEYISYTSIDKLLKNTKTIFSPRKIVPNRKYSIFLEKDSAKFFVYEINAVEYIVYNLSNLTATKGHKLVTKQLKNICGLIDGSLWKSLVEKQVSPILAVELSDVFAWTIDFFGIRKNDTYKIIYEESFVENKSIGKIKIVAACMKHLGENQYAFSHNISSNNNYFDETGKSLQKKFLKAPLKYSRISSRFSNRRYHPVLKYYRAHHGVDYAAPTGTHVFSVGDGVVIKKGYQKRGGGRYLKIKHNSVYTTVYMHFSRFAKGMKVGTKVKQGQLIGYVGRSGLATGPHLDYRIFKNNKAINPLKLKSPSISPIKKEVLQDYLAEILHNKKEMDLMTI